MVIYGIFLSMDFILQALENHWGHAEDTGLRDIGFRKLILVVIRKTYEKWESYLGDYRKWSRQKA